MQIDGNNSETFVTAPLQLVLFRATPERASQADLNYAAMSALMMRDFLRACSQREQGMFEATKAEGAELWATGDTARKLEFLRNCQAAEARAAKLASMLAVAEVAGVTALEGLHQRSKLTSLQPQGSHEPATASAASSQGVGGTWQSAPDLVLSSGQQLLRLELQ